MAENNVIAPSCDLTAIREAVCVHTSKVMDACRIRKASRICVCT